MIKNKESVQLRCMKVLHCLGKDYQIFLAIFLFSIIISIIYPVSISSYGHVISAITGSYDGLIFGKPAPIRSDEYGVLTPLIQTVVLNDYGIANSISVYGESLKIPYALPTMDWGIIFKPQFFLFFISPESGFGFYHLFYLSMFFFGWYQLFLKLLDNDRLMAFLGSVSIGLSPFVQYVFTTHAQSLTFFPFVLLLLIVRVHGPSRIIRVGLIFYLSASLMIADFYPPYFIQYIILSFIIFCSISLRSGFRNTIFNKIFLEGMLASLVGCLVACIYLADVISGLMFMPYAVDAHFSWGRESFSRVLAQFYPAFGFDLRHSLNGPNAVEGSAMGFPLLIPALLLAFLLKSRFPKYIIPYVIALVLISIFQLTPFGLIPEIVPLLNKLNPSRSFLLSGILTVILGIYLLKFHFDLGNFYKIVSLFIAMFLLMCLIKAYFYGVNSIKVDLCLFAFGFVCLAVARNQQWLNVNFYYLTLVYILLIANYPGLIANPIQSVKPIFELRHHHDTKKYASWASNEFGLVTDTSLPGGTWSGLGYKSLTHVLPLPSVEDVKFRLESILKGVEVDSVILSKWLHVRLDFNLDAPVKETFADAITVNTSAMAFPPPRFYAYSQELAESNFTELDKQNFRYNVDNFSEEHGKFCATGWFFPVKPGEFQIDTSADIGVSLMSLDHNVDVLNVKTYQRWDVARTLNSKYGMYSGFNVCARSSFDKILFNSHDKIAVVSLGN